MGAFFVFDVESVGFHGEGFAVGGGVYVDGAAQKEFRFACNSDEASGKGEGRAWVRENCPALLRTHNCPSLVRNAFWEVWCWAQMKHRGILMAADVPWPVEANFLNLCVSEQSSPGPYPLIDIASVMFAAGMDPLKNYDRLVSETPKHDPLADARQSARLLHEALQLLGR